MAGPPPQQRWAPAWKGSPQPEGPPARCPARRLAAPVVGLGKQAASSADAAEGACRVRAAEHAPLRAEGRAAKYVLLRAEGRAAKYTLLRAQGHAAVYAPLRAQGRGARVRSAGRQAFFRRWR